MKTTKLLLILALLIGKVFGAYASTPKTFPHTFFNSERDFYVGTEVSGTWIKARPFSIFLFDPAASSCRISQEDLQRKFKSIADSKSEFWQILETYIPNARKKFLTTHTTITIDNFWNPQKAFSSYFLRETPQPGEGLISLDCHLFESDYWQALLGHEIMHAIFSTMNMESWEEELLAQNIEYQLSGYFPNERIESLRQAVVVPSPVGLERPFSSTEKYAANFLLGQYLQEKWGGQRTLQNLVGAESYRIFTARTKASLIAAKASKKLIERVTPAGLLRHFMAALVLNTDAEKTLGLYKIADWNGFSRPPLEALPELEKVQLEPGSFIRVSSPLFQTLLKRHPGKLKDNIEVYRFLVFEDGSYQIFSGQEAVTKSLSQDFFNLKDDTVTLLRTY